MNFYTAAFLALISACIFLTCRQYAARDESPEEKALNPNPVTPARRAESSRFILLFLTVYGLVMASDWLQGPYVYSLYKDQFGLDERIVALLFTTGFLSGGITGYFVGQFADKYGRKTACLVFCVTYSVACFSTLIPNVSTLFCGRVMGGLSTSLMYSALESWMVTEYHKRQLHQAGTSLSSLFGIMATLNSVVAICSGVFSEWLVEVTHTKRAPFMASAALLSVAFWLILMTWTENYGDNHEEDSPSASGTPPAVKSTLRTIVLDKRIAMLGLASCFFEGSMYLFVFFWTPALVASQPAGAPHLPLGMIFASFMASTMLGSLFFNLVVSMYQLITHTRLLTLIFATASMSLLAPIVLRSEMTTFWSFCVFEACVGMYWPSVGYLKGRFVDDGNRARVYGCLRIPLNVFVVLALSLTREGVAYREGVFMFCGGLLVFISGVFQHFIGEG